MFDRAGRLAFIPIIAALGLAFNVAQAETVTPPIYCKDDTGTLQYMKYFRFSHMAVYFHEKFNFNPSINAGKTALTFSNPKETKFYVRYAIEIYDGEAGPGYALLSMHLNMGADNTTFVGSKMCGLTMEKALGGGE